MNHLKAMALALTLCLTASAQVDTNSQHYYMFVYFLNMDDQAGARIALSTDGIYWGKVNNEAPIFTPTISSERLMRDPNICFDSRTGVFHLVWTCGWNQKTIGYATSKDLKQWGTQLSIPVGEKISNCACCWGPEIFYDDIKDSFMVYWSTETGTNGKRGYCSMTKDFKSYTAPAIFFDPGYSIIDETIFKAAAGKYYLFFKDERTSVEAGKMAKNIHYTTGPTPQGPWDTTGSWDKVSPPVTNLVCEGPTIIQRGSEYRLYFDNYAIATSTYRMVTTTDLASTTVPWPQGVVLKTTKDSNFYYSHGSILEIPRAKFMQLLYGILDETVYESWSTPKQSDITVGGSGVIDTSGDKQDKSPWGCGAGVGLAFFPPLLFKTRAICSRKRKNTAKEMATGRLGLFRSKYF
jgi:hypothetical protein